MLRTIYLLNLLLFLTGCYDSPEPEELNVQGIWRAENYDELLDVSTFKVVMLQFTDDRVEVFFNEPNFAFRFQYQIDGDLMEIGSIALGPDTRLNEFLFVGREGALKLKGLLFGDNGQVYQRANFNDLETYKARNLLNEYGRWFGFEGQIFFELVRGGQGFFRRQGEDYFISIEEFNVMPRIRAERGGRPTEFWDYSVARNVITIGFPDGVAQFDREFQDNIVSLD